VQQKKILAAAAAQAQHLTRQEKQNQVLQEVWTKLSNDSAREGEGRLRAIGMVASSAA